MGSTMKKKIEVGILGATGMVGQQFIAQLESHPWFSVKWLGASERSSGRRYMDAVKWRLPSQLPERISEMTVTNVEPTSAPKILFSGLDASVAGVVEEALAVSGHTVVSNARNHRMDAVVPLIVPEINSEHLDLLEAQTRIKGWRGNIVTNPNCSAVILAMALAPLRQFGLKSVLVTTLQAVSGAGYPGVSSIDILGNIIPIVAGEEEKIETETKKVLGCMRDESIKPYEFEISAHTTRVPVTNGHTEMISVLLESKPTRNEIISAFGNFTSQPYKQECPSAPKQPIVYLDEDNRPQPRLDLDRERGMCVSIGALRHCSVLGHKFVALGHNTIRGAAGTAVLNAELMYVKGLLN